MGLLASKEDYRGELKSFASLREEMVERNIAARGVRDELVLGGMRKVPRELFLPKNFREFAYEDLPLPIAGEQTAPGGWLDHSPYDAIVVAAGGPQVPESLKAQLKIGGRVVIPVGADQRVQELVRVTRVSENEYRSEDIADVRFVPLIGEEGGRPRRKVR